MKEGYIVQKICEIRRICFGCERFKRDMIRSGKHPEYRNACTHPVAIKEWYGSNSMYSDVPILEDQTPDWCPVGERQ